MDDNSRQQNSSCKASKAGLLLSLLAAPTLALSDDIEIYVQQPLNPVPPNILFVLDESGSMGYDGETDGLSRLDELKNALTTVVEDPEMGNVNAALLGYSNHDTGTLFGVGHSGPFKLIAGNEESFTDQITNLESLHYTPTTGALIEAVNWFRPDVDYVDNNGTALASPLENANPEVMQCAPNHIVLLSDGEPNYTRYSSWNGIPCAAVNIFTTTVPSNDLRHQNLGARCSNEVASWAYTTDLMTGSDWPGTQNITVSTMGFYTSNNSETTQYLTDLATAGGGTFYASSGSTIVADLTDIINGARQNIDYAYNAPAVPFNSDNAAISGEEIYIPLIKPDSNLFWKGNLKKYNISLTDDEIVITDSSGSPVLNESKQFNDTRDEWASSNDDGDVLVGGAAENMRAGGNRMLFSNVDDDSAELSAMSNRVHEENELITMAMLGVGSPVDRKTVLDWISWDPSVPADESHEGEMGAPIHTQPVVVDYGDTSTIYIPTSEGVLEAFDENTGAELWAFMPQDLLRNIRLLRLNDSSTPPYYGLDGPLTVYETSGHKMAIVGMRRGGNEYYLLDITDRLNPELVTILSGDDEDGPFNKLGQTWSKPMFVKMNINGTPREVLVFGGGYDVNQDTATVRSSDSVGNVIYIVDALSGALLKSISNSGSSHDISNMTNAIPSDIMTIDLNGDALVDRIYAADVGGRIIRVDVDAMTGGIVADINGGGGGVSSQYRRFFNTPQIGYYSKGGKTFLAILIGTGDRSKPLADNVTDRFYMIMDREVWAAPTTYTAATESDLINATSISADINNIANIDKKGWYIDLAATEKSYSKAILYDHTIFFTTFIAESTSSDDPCEATGTMGEAKIYGIDLLTASAAMDWQNGVRSQTPLPTSARSLAMSMPGIPPTPMLIFPGATNEDGDSIIGKKIFLFSDLEKKAEWSDRFRPIYWEEVIEDS